MAHQRIVHLGIKKDGTSSMGIDISSGISPLDVSWLDDVYLDKGPFVHFKLEKVDGALFLRCLKNVSIELRDVNLFFFY